MARQNIAVVQGGEGEVILGCDPGVKGAFAHLAGASLTVRSMPLYQRPAGARNTLRNFIDRKGVVALLQGYRMLGAEILVIEKVGGFEGQSVHGAFMFGHGAGGVTYAAEALGYRIEEVAPATWKSALKVPADKKHAIARADELLPAWVNWWADYRGAGGVEARAGRAEAALLALYGREVFQ